MIHHIFRFEFRTRAPWDNGLSIEREHWRDSGGIVIVPDLIEAPKGELNWLRLFGQLLTYKGGAGNFSPLSIPLGPYGHRREQKNDRPYAEADVPASCAPLYGSELPDAQKYDYEHVGNCQNTCADETRYE